MKPPIAEMRGEVLSPHLIILWRAETKLSQWASIIFFLFGEMMIRDEGTVGYPNYRKCQSLPDGNVRHLCCSMLFDAAR